MPAKNTSPFHPGASVSSAYHGEGFPCKLLPASSNIQQSKGQWGAGTVPGQEPKQVKETKEGQNTLRQGPGEGTEQGGWQGTPVEHARSLVHGSSGGSEVTTGQEDSG